MKLKELAEKAGLDIKSIGAYSDYFCEIVGYDGVYSTRFCMPRSKREARAFLEGYIAAKEVKPEPEQKVEPMKSEDERIIERAGKLNISARRSMDERWILWADRWYWTISTGEAWGFLCGYGQARKDFERECKTS